MLEGTGTGSLYPCTLTDLRSAVEDLMAQLGEDDDA